MNKQTIAVAAIVTILGLGVVGSTQVMAQTATDESHMTSLAQKIAQKFGLNQADVEAVFREEHEARKTEMKAKSEERLTALVTEGKITEAQKKLILDKMAELEKEREANKDSMRNLTPEQRKTQMETKRTELKAWAEQNGIDLQFMMPFGGHGRGHGDFGVKMKIAPDATSTTAVTQ